MTSYPLTLHSLPFSHFSFLLFLVNCRLLIKSTRIWLILFDQSWRKTTENLIYRQSSWNIFFRSLEWYTISLRHKISCLKYFNRIAKFQGQRSLRGAPSSYLLTSQTRCCSTLEIANPRYSPPVHFHRF